MFVDTFLLSCRALGRGVENTMVAYLTDFAKSLPLSFAFQKTDKGNALSGLQDLKLLQF